MFLYLAVGLLVALLTYSFGKEEGLKNVPLVSLAAIIVWPLYLLMLAAIFGYVVLVDDDFV